MKTIKASLLGFLLTICTFCSASIVQTKTVDCSAGCTNVTITPDSATTTGDTLVVARYGDGAATSVETSAGQWLLNSSAGESDATVFTDFHYLLNALSSTTITVNESTWHGYAVFYEISGVNVVDQAKDTTTSLSSTTSASVSATTTQATEVVLGILGGFPSTPTLTGSMTSTDYSTSAAVFGSASETATGTYSFGGTWTSGSGRPTLSMITLYEGTQPTAYTPIFSPAGGRYGSSVSVTVNVQTSGGVAHCTTDGTTPTSSSTAYSGAFTVSSGSETIECLVVGPAGYNNSSVVSNTYTITGVTTPTTWYVRGDGGSIYDANSPYGQCDGTHDAAYPGTTNLEWTPATAYTLGTVITDNAGYYETVTTAGTSGTGRPSSWGTTTTDGTVTWTKGSAYPVDQACGLGDYRYLYDDQNSYNSLKWAIQGGDTVIIEDGPWRVGWEGTGAGSDVWCKGGSNSGCSNPPIPSGTSSQHTEIYGANYAACTTGGATDRSKLTQLFGGHGVGNTLNLKGAQYVDVACLEVTSHAQCITHGSPALPVGCTTGTPVSDYDSDGIATDHNTHDVTLTDIYDHGHTDRGIKGAIGGTVTCLRCDIAYNGMAGWDLDDGTNNQASGKGLAAQYGSASYYGTLNFDYSTIEWSGCNQIYPGTGANTCYGQSNGGYGDGIGSPPGGCVNVSIDHSAMLYNVQDGTDIGHEDAGPSGAGYSDQTFCSYSVTNSYAFGNSGAPYKWGPNNSPATMIGNVLIANCHRLAADITGADSDYNTNLGDYCRSGDATSFNFHAGGEGTFANNTLVTYFQTALLGDCWEGDYECPGVTYNFYNNIVYGLEAPSQTYNGNNNGIGGFYFDNGSSYSAVISTFNRSNNIFYGVRNITCPTGYSNELCTDPLFVNEPAECLVEGGSGCTFTEAAWDVFLPTETPYYPSYYITPSSPAIGAGTTYTGVPADDYLGTATTSPPVVGALNYKSGSLNAITVTPSSASVVIGSTQTYTASCVYTDGGSSPCTIAWSDTGSHSSIGSTTGVVTAVSVGTDTITATMSTFSGTATVTIAAPVYPLIFQGLGALQGNIQ